MVDFTGADLLPALFLLAPGYSTLLIMRRLIILRKMDGTFEWTVSSLALSGVILAVFVQVHSIRNAIEFTSFFYSQPVQSVLEVVSLSVVVAFILAYVLYKDFFTRLVYRLILRTRYRPLDQETWDTFMANCFSRAVQVRTKNGEEFKGIVMQNSTMDEPKAVRLAAPQQVFYDPDGNVTGYAPLGHELLLMGDDIVRVAMLSSELFPLAPEPRRPSLGERFVTWARAKSEGS